MVGASKMPEPQRDASVQPQFFAHWLQSPPGKVLIGWVDHGNYGAKEKEGKGEEERLR